MTKDKEKRFLKGVYGPVEKELFQECEVVGVLPEAIQGEFARNGPNPRFHSTGGYHWFDGDGMVHGVRIKAGNKVVYTNRYVRTKKLKEEKAGKPLQMNWRLQRKVRACQVFFYTLKKKVGVIPDFEAELEGTANTSLTYHGGRLMALVESSLPYALRVMCDGMIETIGQATFDGKLNIPFTAHPKKDPVTGKLYGFGYQLPLDVLRATMMHDFHITENYAVFMDLPLLFKGERVASSKMPFVFDKSQGARMGVLSLDATDTSGMRWFDLPEVFSAFHVLNAWEERVGAKDQAGAALSYHSVVKTITCDAFDFDLEFPVGIQGLSEGDSTDQRPVPCVTTLNLDTGEASRAKLLPGPVTEGFDFPQIRQSLLGRKARFGYCVGHDEMDYPTAVVKLDFQAASLEKVIVGRIDLGDWVGSEALFIPSKPEYDVLAGVGEEDDGYLVAFVTPRDGSNSSELRVWDAKTMNPEPVAKVKLPGRVPMGFHAIFITEEELSKQRE